MSLTLPPFFHEVRGKEVILGDLVLLLPVFKFQAVPFLPFGMNVAFGLKKDGVKYW